jgi:hypothetical protein
VCFVKKYYEQTESVTRLLDGLGWESLETRRLHARLRLLERFRTGFFQGEVDNIIFSSHYVSRFDKSDNIREIYCRTDRYKNSFSAALTAIINTNHCTNYSTNMNLPI